MPVRCMETLSVSTVGSHESKHIGQDFWNSAYTLESGLTCESKVSFLMWHCVVVLKCLVTLKFSEGKGIFLYLSVHLYQNRVENNTLLTGPVSGCGFTFVVCFKMLFVWLILKASRETLILEHILRCGPAFPAFSCCSPPLHSVNRDCAFVSWLPRLK